jgi:hypothetical protein
MSHPIRFTPEEAFSSSTLRAIPPSLQIGGGLVDYKAALIRLLTGTVNIRCNLSGVLIKQRTNYSQLIYFRNGRISSNTIKKAIRPYKLKDLDKYLIKRRTSNLRFYRELFIEFSNYFLRRQENNQIAAFLHLYRILESCAFSFPLIWASRANDYEGTFKKLREYFNSPDTGELRVFKRFIDDMVDSAILNTQAQLVIISIHPDWQRSYYDTLFRNIDQGDIVSYTANSDITIKCGCLTGLLINIRNKYFHFLTGQGNNFNSDDIAEPNEFFSIVNEILANWLSIIFFEILDHELNNL